MNKLDIDRAVKNITSAMREDHLAPYVNMVPSSPVPPELTKMLRGKLGLPIKLGFGEFANGTKYPIPYAAKVRLARYVTERLCSVGFTQYFVMAVLNIGNRSLIDMQKGKIANIAIALDDYFVKASIKLEHLRKLLSGYCPGVNFTEKGFSSLSEEEIKSIRYCLVTRLNLSRPRMRKIFCIKKDNDHLLEVLYIKET